MLLCGLTIFTASFIFVNASSIGLLTDLRDGSNDTPPDDCPAQNGFETYQNYDKVEEFERCAPYLLPDYARIYYVAAFGRQVTKRLNRIAYTRLLILQRILRDVSNFDLSTTVLGSKVSLPIGAAPAAFQRFASPDGEVDTARAFENAGSLLILSSLATRTLEEVAEAAPELVKWMQVYVFLPREETLQLIRRAEKAGYKAIVVSVDSPIIAGAFDDPYAVGNLENPEGLRAVNVGDVRLDPSLTFRDLAWIVKQTELPVVAKGVLTPYDALRLAASGCAGVIVSNHGGRQLDFSPATIDVLPGIAEALRKWYPKVEVYIDGGVRNGYDVFKALARGARMVFIGRPQLWGLAAGAEQGVSKVLNILKNELTESMKLAGVANVRSFDKDMVQDDRHVTEKCPKFP